MKRMLAAAVTVGLFVCAALTAGCHHEANGHSARLGPAHPDVTLADAMLGERELPGWSITDSGYAQILKGQVYLPPRPAACQPLDDVAYLQIKPAPKTYVVKEGFAYDVGRTAMVTIQILGYSGHEGDGIIPGIREALRRCVAGYVATGTAASPKDTEQTVKELTAPACADDAVAFSLSAQSARGQFDVPMTVVRRRSTLLVFNDVTLYNHEVRDDLVKAQLAKLDKLGF